MVRSDFRYLPSSATFTLGPKSLWPCESPWVEKNLKVLPRSSPLHNSASVAPTNVGYGDLRQLTVIFRFFPINRLSEDCRFFGPRAQLWDIAPWRLE